MTRQTESLPKNHNERADGIWEVVRPHLPRPSGDAIDLGCGGGDMLWRLCRHGYDTVVGYDRKLTYRTVALAEHWPVYLRELDLEALPSVQVPLYEVALCLSVLPHLQEPWAWLARMRTMARVWFIECQYSVEPPYPTMPADDGEMADRLYRCGFTYPEAIGRTHVGIVDAYRTIWKAN